MRRVMFLAPIGLFLATALGAGLRPIPGSDPRTLLRVHRTLRDQVRPEAFVLNDQNSLITRGGGLVIIRASSLDDQRPETILGVGLGNAADLALLGQALTAAPVGSAMDCSLNGVDRTGKVEITWYGRSGRRNRFSITFLDHEPTEEDRCPDTTKAIFDAIEVFEETAGGRFP